MKRLGAVLALAVAGSAVASADDYELLTTLMWRFRNDPEGGVQRLRYAVTELGADVSVTDDAGRTPLCEARRVEFAKELISLGAALQGGGAWTLFLCAALYDAPGDTSLLEWLIDDLAMDVNHLGDDGETALCSFASYSTAEHVSLLLARGADPNLYGGATSNHPLVCALQNLAPWEDVLEIVQALREAGAKRPVT